MAMIELNRVRNQSLSLVRSNRGHGRSNSSGGLNLRQALLGLLAAVIFVCPLIMQGQELSATLSGVVMDSSGAVIPKATVSISQSGTSAVRTVQSDESGNYAFSNVPAGTYTLKASSTGFTSFVAKDVILRVGEARGLNVQLKAGAATTTVTVEATAVTVDTESAAQAGNLSSQQIEGLELAGRNFQQLVTLQPGVVSQMGDETSAGNTAMSVNGARTTANNWTIDGADINDSGSNGTVINAPNVDAISEFTLQRGNYDAGYGRSGGGQVLVATKSGTSAFHGDAYEFVRNTIFDSNEWFNKRTQAENDEPNKNPINHHNVYGFTIGGPVFIPKVYNTDKRKTFFFWSEEWRKLSTPGGDSMPAASQAQLNGVVAGNFTNAPEGCATYDPSTDTTQLSPSCYSANSNVYLTSVFDKYPANNSNGNYSFSTSSQNNFRDDIVRVDHYFSDKIHFYARGINDDMPVAEPEGLWAGSNYPGLVNTLVNSPGKNVVGNLTWTINPNVVNEFEFVWSQGTYYSAIDSGQFATSSAVNSALTNQWSPDPYGKVPAISIIGVTGFNAGSAPWNERNLDRTYFDNLSFNFGKHTLRTGFMIQQMIKTENAVNGEPSFSFNSWGDFLVGNVASFTQTLPDIIPDLHFINFEVYAQDDWKVSRRLTLNLGLRWSRLPSVTDVKNTLSNFDPNYYSVESAPQIDPSSGNFVAGQYINGVELIPSTYTNGMIFPTGTACSNAKAIAPLSSCSPFGAYVNPNYNDNFAPRVGFAYDLFGTGKTVLRGGFGIFYDRLLDGIWEQNAFGNPPFAQRVTIVNAPFDDITSGSTSVPLGPNGLTATGNPTFKVPNYANYNLSLQQQLSSGTVFEMAYVGNQARHLLGEYDENQPTVGARIAVNADESLGPNTSVNYIRPFAGYAGITARAPFFSNNYNSLQVSLNHHSHGLQVGLAYTWSKDLTTNSSDRSNVATDSYDFSLDYGLSSYNQPQTFTANYVYDLPFFKTQQGFTGKLLGGWQASGITSFFSGQSFSLTQPHDPWDPNGLNVGLGIGSARPDQISLVQRTKTVGQWFTTSSFAPALYHFGSERNGSLLGPGYNNWDLAAIKNISFHERYNFQLRGEFFNAFNHESFETVDSALADSSFGQVTAGHSPRRIQLGAKFNF